MDNKQKIYHTSKVKGLTLLEPRISTHGKAYVYGTKHVNLSLLFGGCGCGDFDGMYGFNDIPYFYEAYPHAFYERFANQTGYVYELDPTDFLEGKTGFSAEVVSEKPVKVLSCFEIKDLYEYFMDLIAKGELDFQPYSYEEEYQNKIKEHIRDRLVRFEVYKGRNLLELCRKRFPELTKEYEENLKKENNVFKVEIK